MIAIIPARGGSKGLPGKNIKDLNGKPLIAYTIEAALKSKCIDDIILSTDDENIQFIATEYGARSPFLRPPELATDDALATDTYIYTIETMEEMTNTAIEDFMVLQPTSPLRTAQDIDSAYQLFRNHNADSVISYTEEVHPITWHKYLEEDGRILNIFDDKMVNRQALRKSYYPNGAIYIFKTSLIRKRQFYTHNSFAYLMPRERAVDIDMIDDFKFAEYLMSNLV